MKNMRKFILTLASLAIFALIMLKNPAIDPFNLGLGICFLLVPTSAANALEHKYKNRKKKK